MPGIQNVGVFHIVGQPNLEIEIDREACARYGVNVADVESNVKVAIGGEAFSQMVEGEKLYDIVLRLPKDLRDDPGDIAHLAVDVPGPKGKPGARIPLSQLATIDPHKPGASYIYRENNRRYLPIKFAVQGRDLASAIGEAQAKVNDPKYGAELPPGYRLEWSGEFAQMEKANARLMWIVPISIGLIMVLLYTAFNSLKDALLVMMNVVAATMGGVWALQADRHAVLDLGGRRIHLDLRRRRPGRRALDFVFQSDASQGMSVRDAVMRGAELRVRPVVMTSLTAALGLLARGHGQLDRLAGPETAGDRRGRRHARDSLSDPLPDARALHVLSRPRHYSYDNPSKVTLMTHDTF